jgi:hypothetical protein
MTDLAGQREARSRILPRMFTSRSFSSNQQRRDLGLRSLLWLVALPLLACRSDQSIQPEPVRAPALPSVLARLPFVSPLLAGASTSPARAIDRDGFVVEGQATPAPGPAPGRRLRTTDRPTRVELGALASDAMRVMTTGAGWLSLRRQGARAQAGRVEGGVVVYADAFPGADALVVSKDGGVEELVLARGPETRMVYEVDLPAGWALAEHRKLGLVEVRDERGAARLRVWANKAWDATGTEVPVHAEVKGREIALRVEGKARWPVVVDPFFVGTANMVATRVHHTATKLDDGKVLVVGGARESFRKVAEVYDPASETFTAGAAEMIFPRRFHTATRLGDGKVLLAGGGSEALDSGSLGAQPTAEVYDPVSGEFSAAPSMSLPRVFHTATLLPDGRVLIAGGRSNTNATSTATDSVEVYDPEAGAFSVLPAKMSSARARHTATLLKDGQVLLAGGFDGFGHSSTADRFDPSSGAFTGVSMLAKRGQHAAERLSDGRVLIAGGRGDQGALRSAELYDPASGQFSPSGAVLPSDRLIFKANRLDDGRVFISPGGGEKPDDRVYLYEPASDRFSPVGGATMLGCLESEATTLDDGKILLSGGLVSGEETATAEVFSPAERFRVTTSRMPYALALSSATRLGDGKILIAGGTGLYLNNALLSNRRTASLFDPSTGVFSVLPSRMKQARASLEAGSGSMAAVLKDGRVLFTGETSLGLGGADVYDQATGGFSDTFGSTTVLRSLHQAILLDSGKVLLTGGELSPKTAELYDPQSGTFKATSSSMIADRVVPGTARLPDGRVLLVGGRGSKYSENCGAVRPGARYVRATSSMSFNRYLHSVTRLPDGKILVAGGDFQDTAEIYAVTETFSMTTGSTRSPSMTSGQTPARREPHAVVIGTSDGAA